jgi:hypothetical protein
MMVGFRLVQQRDLQRCAGAKVGGDLLALKPINISQPQSAFWRFSMQGLAAKIVNQFVDKKNGRHKVRPCRFRSAVP